MTVTKIQVRSGTLAELNTITLDNGEIGFTTDTKEIFVGYNGSNYATNRQYGVLIPIDYNMKGSYLNLFTKTSGSGILSYSDDVGVIGTGSFRIVGNGTWVLNRVTAISALTGIGGQISVKGVAIYSIGCLFYDQDMVLISSTNQQKNYIANSVGGSASYVQYSNYLKEEGVGNNNIPVGAKYARPFITVSSNASSVYFDHYMQYFLTTYSFFA